MARIEKTIDVGVPVQTAFRQCSRFQDLPRFMEGIEQVVALDDRRLRVRVAFAGIERQVEVEITEQVPDQAIEWRGPNGATGQVSVSPMHESCTRVSLEVDYEPEGLLANLGQALGMSSRHVESGLERFKAFVERRGIESGQPPGDRRRAHPADGSAAEHEGVVSVGANIGAGRDVL